MILRSCSSAMKRTVFSGACLAHVATSPCTDSCVSAVLCALCIAERAHLVERPEALCARGGDEAVDEAAVRHRAVCPGRHVLKPRFDHVERVAAHRSRAARHQAGQPVRGRRVRQEAQQRRLGAVIKTHLRSRHHHGARDRRRRAAPQRSHALLARDAHQRLAGMRVAALLRHRKAPVCLHAHQHKLCGVAQRSAGGARREAARHQRQHRQRRAVGRGHPVLDGVVKAQSRADGCCLPQHAAADAAVQPAHAVGAHHRRRGGQQAGSRAASCLPCCSRKLHADLDQVDRVRHAARGHGGQAACHEALRERAACVRRSGVGCERGRESNVGRRRAAAAPAGGTRLPHRARLLRAAGRQLRARRTQRGSQVRCGGGGCSAPLAPKARRLCGGRRQRGPARSRGCHARLRRRERGRAEMRGVSARPWRRGHGVTPLQPARCAKGAAALLLARACRCAHGH